MTKALTLRLDKLLGNLGYGTRREVQLMARQCRIRSSGEPLRDIEKRVTLTPDFVSSLTLDGAPLDPLPGMVLMLNKPLGVTCSHKEAGDLVYGLLPERWRLRQPPISSVGRLDKDTSGLLLMTDDGDLLHKIIAPRSHLPKRYRATLDRPLAGDEGEIFASGTLMLNGEDKPLLPAALDVVSPTEAILSITEGRYHQVRRMFAAVKNHVTALHRLSIGPLPLPETLGAGEFSVLTGAELAALRASLVPRKNQDPE